MEWPREAGGSGTVLKREEMAVRSGVLGSWGPRCAQARGLRPRMGRAWLPLPVCAAGG